MTVSSVPPLTSLAYYKLRDEFAGQAMAALVATPVDDWPATGPMDEPTSVSLVAYALADAMLAARSLPRKDQK